MELSIRLKRIAAFAEKGKTVADIGTDHGFVPIYLVKEGIMESAIAMDIKEAPLKRAEEHIRENGLGGKITVRKSNGLEALKRKEADCVIISGMGGPLIADILEQGREHWPDIHQFILSPQSDWEGFRRYLERSGFTVVREEMLKEDGKFYLMTDVRFSSGESVKTEGQPENLGHKLNLRYGELLLKRKDPVLLEYLIWKHQVASKIEMQLKTQPCGEDKRRLSRLMEIRQEKKFIELALQKIGGTLI